MVIPASNTPPGSFSGSHVSNAELQAQFPGNTTMLLHFPGQHRTRNNLHDGDQTWDAIAGVTWQNLGNIAWICGDFENVFGADQARRVPRFGDTRGITDGPGGDWFEGVGVQPDAGGVWTLEGWGYLESTGGTGHLVEIGSIASGDHSVQLLFNGDLITTDIQSNVPLELYNSTATSVGKNQKDRWVHWAVSRNVAGNITTWADGVRVSQSGVLASEGDHDLIQFRTTVPDKTWWDECRYSIVERYDSTKTTYTVPTAAFVPD